MKKLLSLLFVLAVCLGALVVSASAAEVNVTCPNYSFTALDGSTVSVNEGKATLLIFYQPGCWNCKNTISNLAAADWVDHGGLNVIAADFRSASTAEVKAFADTYGNGGADINFCRTTSSAMWNLLSLVGHGSNSVTTPACFVIDSNAVIRHYMTGNTSAQTFYSALENYLPVSITGQPADVTVQLGETVKFTVEADGEGLTYQWQYRTSASGTWKNTTLTGNKTDTLTVKATAGRDDYQYRCVVKGANGNTLPSDAATLAVVIVPDTPTVSLSIKASNGKPQLKWAAAAGADKYEIWRAVGKNSGYTKVYTTTSTSYTNTSAYVGKTYYYKVRAVGEDGKSGFSTAKYVTCDCAQPVVSITLNANNKPKLTWEKVTGASKYEIWRAVGQDSGYKKIYTMTGNVFTNSSVEEGETYYYKVRAVCGATTAGNSAFSTAKSVTVPIPLNIVSQPEDASAALGGKAKFSVEAEGIGLTYQWQYCTAKGTKWTNTTLTGNKTATLTVGVTAGRDGYKYRCVITDVNGDSVTSAYGKLTVK